MSRVKYSVKTLSSSDSFRTFAAAVFSVFTGLLAGCIIIFLWSLYDKDINLKEALEGIKLILLGVLCKGKNSEGDLYFGFNPVIIGNLLFRATPVIMTGLSVASAFRSGLFNIGAPGQYLMGGAATLILALKLPSDLFPVSLIWLIAFSGGMAAGALWGLIPGALKSRFRVNEVLSGIMLNWISAGAVTWIFENSSLRNTSQAGKIGYIMKTSVNSVATPDFGLSELFPDSQVNGGIIIAAVLAVTVHIFLNKTVMGYEMKACAGNRNAAELSGVNCRKIITLSMTVAGALSGGGAALYYLSGNTEFFWSTYQLLPAEGFNGIPVALLSGNNPLGVIVSGCFMAMLNISGQQLKNLTTFNETVINIIIGIIVYMSAFSLFIKRAVFNFKRKSK